MDPATDLDIINKGVFTMPETVHAAIIEIDSLEKMKDRLTLCQKEKTVINYYDYQKICEMIDKNINRIKHTQLKE